MRFSDSHHTEPGRRQYGGMVFKGLCRDCNSHAGRFDDAYGDLVDLLPRPDEAYSELVLPGWQPRIHFGTIRAGAIARSMMFGAFALNPTLRELVPEVADALIHGDPIDLGRHDRRLMIANGTGERCRVHGGMLYVLMAGPRINGQLLRWYADAGAHLRPLSWMLGSTEVGVPDIENWLDVSDWLLLNSNHEQISRTRVPSLPAVDLPNSEMWGLMTSDKNCITVEAAASFPGSTEWHLGGVPLTVAPSAGPNRAPEFR